MIKVTAVIVNYHTCSLIDTLLNDIVESPVVGRIIIVDNSRDYVNSTFNDRVQIITPQKNIGFAAGVNLAAEQISSEWILLLNPDMRIPSGAVERLVAGAESAGAVLAGPRFYWDDEQKFRLPPALGASSWMDYALMSQSFYQLDALHLSFYWQIRHDRFWNATTPFVEPFLSGACILINREWAESSNRNRHEQNSSCYKKNSNLTKKWILDPRFFMYYEDTDLAVSASLDGKPPMCIPASEMIHYYNQSPEHGKSKIQMMTDSHALFKEKNYPALGFEVKCESRYIPEYIDLKKINQSYLFQTEHTELDGLCFEIGVNPFFIPFIQTKVLKGESKSIKDAFMLGGIIWNRLAKGMYYGRIRDNIKGTLKIWKWEK